MIASTMKVLLPLCAAILAGPCKPGFTEYSPSDEEDTGDGEEPGETGEPSEQPDLPDEIEPACEPSPGAKQLAIGGSFSCAMQHCGEVVCWGANGFGQLGQGHVENLGDNEQPNTAGPIELGGPAVSIVAGRDHACALRVDGALLCWGMSFGGALGYGDLNIVGNNERPHQAGIVDVGRPIRSIHAGPGRSCAITTDRALVCWGNNQHGQLGYGHTQTIGDDEAPSTAGVVDVGGPVIDVALSSGNICAVLDGGDVRCWGLRGATLGAGHDPGQPIGDNEVPASRPKLELGGPARAIEAGFNHVCALLEDGALVCWGSGTQGQLGHGNFASIGDDETPASVGPVPLGEPAIAMALGVAHSCAIGESGRARCWGETAHGRLGYPDVMEGIGGELLPSEVGPIELPGMVDELGAGYAHTCARIGGDVLCWGAGWDGALGYGNTNHLGDDEPPGSGGPVKFFGGSGSGVQQKSDEFDEDPDASLYLISHADAPPAGLVVSQTIHIRGSHWMAFECEKCTDSMVVYAADGKTVILAQIREREGLHPHRGILNMLGHTPADWASPLELELSGLDLCPPLESEQVGCSGMRRVLEVDVPNSGTARLIDRSRGLAGGGYMISVAGLQDWSDACVSVDEVSRRSVTAIRQDCAPHCGPIAVVDDCEAPLALLDGAWLAFQPTRRPLDPGYEVSCRVLSVDEDGAQKWRLDLDCVGLR